MSNILDCLTAAPLLMPLPGESPATPSPSASPRAPAEGRQASRRRSLDLVAEAHGDVDGFVKDLDLKRRLLDDQIHKFISQKDREFKLYERELRTRYRTPSSSSSTAPVPTPPTDAPSSAAPAPAPAPPSPKPVASTLDNASLRNEPKHEREAELLGLFTPAFLPLIDGHPPAIERSPSAPPLTDSIAASSIAPERQPITRSQTEPLSHVSGTPTSRAALGPRTPSSGSETGKNLVSALKSPSSKPRLPREKRVSLFVDDAVVAPSDNIPDKADPDPESQSSGEPTVNDRKDQQDSQLPNKDPQEQEPTNTKPSDPALTISPPVQRQPGGLRLGLASTTQPSPAVIDTFQTPVKSHHDDELSSPFTMDEEFGHPQSPLTDSTHIEDIDADTDSAPESESTLRATSPDSLGSPTTSPVRQTSTLDIPITRIRSSSSSSAQPTEPGFSRPSVREDPQFAFADEPPAETPAQGSFYDSFSRPSLTKQPVVGSLGESFMQRNAEDMMRRRQSSQRS